MLFVCYRSNTLQFSFQNKSRVLEHQSAKHSSSSKQIASHTRFARITSTEMNPMVVPVDRKIRWCQICDPRARVQVEDRNRNRRANRCRTRPPIWLGTPIHPSPWAISIPYRKSNSFWYCKNYVTSKHACEFCSNFPSARRF